MKHWLAATTLALASMPAHAICVVSGEYSYGGQLDAADHVFAAILTQATLEGDALQLQQQAVARAAATAPNRAVRVPYKIRYDYRVLATFKGDPAAVDHLQVETLYDLPDGRDMSIAESTAWQPGDVVLVVASGAGPATLNFCGASKPFEYAEDLLRKEGRHDLDALLPVRKAAGGTP